MNWKWIETVFTLAVEKRLPHSLVLNTKPEDSNINAQLLSFANRCTEIRMVEMLGTYNMLLRRKFAEALELFGSNMRNMQTGTIAHRHFLMAMIV